jgi:hypothetical protein
VTTTFQDARRNQLLAALPDAEWQRWLPQLEPVEMPLGKVLYESGRRGHIIVLDRKRLEQRACECYAVVKKVRPAASRTIGDVARVASGRTNCGSG